MKKQARQRDKFGSVGNPRSRQAPARGSLLWIFVAVFCLIAVIMVFGIANASQNNQGNQTLTKEQQQQRQQQAAAQGHIQPKSAPQTPVSQPQTAPTRQAGIIAMQQGPFLSSVFTARNFWQGPVKNDWLLAYAGLKPNPDGNGGTGGIRLYNETVNAQGGFDLQLLGTFLAPTGTTGLKITAVNGLLLQLHSDTGQTLTFDLQTHQFH